MFEQERDPVPLFPEYMQVVQDYETSLNEAAAHGRGFSDPRWESYQSTGLTLDWVREAASQPGGISPLAIRAQYLDQLERLEPPAGPLAEKRLARARQSAYAFPIRITLEDLRREVSRQAERLLSKGDALDLLLDPNLAEYGLHNALAARLQYPKSTKLLTQRRLAALNLRLLPRQRPIFIYAPAPHRTFLRDGVKIPLAQATGEEQWKIIAGELPVQTEARFALNRAYDVGQLDISPLQRESLLAPAAPAPSFDDMKRFAAQLRAPGGQALQVAETPIAGLPLRCFYDKVQGTIYIDSKLSPAEKPWIFLQGLSQALVESTSPSRPEAFALEARILCATLQERYGFSPAPAERAALAGAFQLAAEASQAGGLERLLARTCRAGAFVAQSVERITAQRLEQELTAAPKLRQPAVQKPSPQPPGQSEELLNFLDSIQ